MSKQRHEGYLIIDHRDSPGVPSQLTHSLDKFFPDVRQGMTFESATVTCCHCNAVVILNPDRTRPRGYCAKCDQYVCDKPGCSLECTNFSRVLDTLQEHAFKNLNLKEL